MTTDNALVQLFASCHSDPARFHQLVLNQPPLFPHQREMLDVVMKNDISVIISGNQLGKTVLQASLLLWWLYTRRNAVVVSTSSTYKQLKEALWGKVRAFKDNARFPLPGKLTAGTSQRLEIDNEWYALGTTTTDASKISGFRSPLGNTLVLLDEASGIDEAVWEGVTSIGARKMVLTGNPLRNYGFFYDMSLKADLVENAGLIGKIVIPCSRSPHYRLKHSPYNFASQGWIDLQRQTWGESSGWWKSHVLAQFPGDEDNALIDVKWLDIATVDEYSRDEVNGPVRLGIDVAEGTGEDSAFICAFDDNGILELTGSNRWGFEEIAGRARKLSDKYGVLPGHVCYDQSGGGADFNNRLAAVGIMGAVGYKGKSRSGNKQYANLRTRCAYKIRNRLRPDRVDVNGVVQTPFSIPRAIMLKLKKELLALQVENVDESQVALVAKDRMTKVLGHSPDAVDSWIVGMAAMV